MINRTAPFLIFSAVGIAGFDGAVRPRASGPAVCTLDTSSSNFTLERIQNRLDPADTTYFGSVFRAAHGLTGVVFSDISVVVDSARCVEGIHAYARIEYPGDSVKQSDLAAFVENIFIVRLSANRYVLNANFYSAVSAIRHVLVDFTFGLVTRNF